MLVKDRFKCVKSASRVRMIVLSCMESLASPSFSYLDGQLHCSNLVTSFAKKLHNLRGNIFVCYEFKDYEKVIFMMVICISSSSFETNYAIGISRLRQKSVFFLFVNGFSETYI